MRYCFAALLLFLFISVQGQERSLVKGTLLNFEGNPVSPSHVHLKEYGSKDIITTVEASEDGSYEIAVEKRGFYELEFTAPFCTAHSIPFLNYTGREVAVDVSLAGLDYRDNIGNVVIIGSFNDFDWNSGLVMENYNNGTYTITIETDEPELEYQLLSIVRGRSISGTDYEKLRYDGDGDYISIVSTKDGKAEITFDTTLLVYDETPAEVMYQDKNSIDARFYEYHSAYQMEHEKAYEIYQKQHFAGEEYYYDWSGYIQKLETVLNTEEEAPIVFPLSVLYVSLAVQRGAEIDTAKAVALAEKIPLSSCVWLYQPGSVFIFSHFLGENKREEFLDTFLEATSYTSLKAYIYFSRYMNAKNIGNKEETEIYKNLIFEEAPESKYADFLKSNSDSDEKLLSTGDRLPDFSFVSLDDSSVVFTKESMLGKIYLIDFWATWCSPCVRELEEITKVYEKYHPEGLEIISVSFDLEIGKLLKFRDERYAMPWKHNFAQEDERNGLSKIFAIAGIPRPILVGKDGIILELGEELRGENLEKTIAKYFED